MTIKKPQKKNKSIKTLLTVRELKTWLDGYCSAHGDDWSPTPDQWNLIKDKLFSLEDEHTVKHEPFYATPYGGSPTVNTQPAPSYETFPPSGPINRGTTVTLPTQFGGSYEQSTQAAPGGFVGATNSPAIIHKDGKLITPSKDTAGGPSDFA